MICVGQDGITLFLAKDSFFERKKHALNSFLERQKYTPTFQLISVTNLAGQFCTA